MEKSTNPVLGITVDYKLTWIRMCRKSRIALWPQTRLKTIKVPANRSIIPVEPLMNDSCG